MGYGSRGRPAQRLDHPDVRRANLVLPGFSAQLQHRFHRLVDARCAARIAACLKTAQRGGRNPAVQRERAVRGELPACAVFGETGGFQAERGENTERIVIFEEVDGFQRKPRLLQRPLDRKFRCLEVQRVRTVVQRQRVR